MQWWQLQGLTGSGLFRHGIYVNPGSKEVPTMRPFARPRHRRVIKGESGLTLIEVMAAMLVLSLGLLTLLPMATLSIQANVSAGETDHVIAQIQNRIELLRNSDVITSGYEVDTLTGMTTQWWPETESEDLKKVIVEVRWYSESGVPHVQRGETYMYRDE